MSSDRHEALIRGLAPDARPRRLPLPPSARAILWLDTILFAAAALALAGMPPVLGPGTSVWTWSALAGSALTAALAALAAFELTEPGRGWAWTWLPAPAFVLWMGASGLGCFAITDGADTWGALDEAGQCLKFLLAVSAPLLALILFMLWWAAPLMPVRVVVLGGLASAGAAASLLALVHPHRVPLIDLGAHTIAIAVVLATSAAAARLRPRRTPVNSIQRSAR